MKYSVCVKEIAIACCVGMGITLTAVVLSIPAFFATACIVNTAVFLANKSGM